MHIRAEHRRMFPAILNATQDQSDDVPPLESVKDLLAQLQRDHDFFVRELAAAVRLARGLVVEDKNPKETIARIRKMVIAVHKLLETHNELEESQVYVMAEDIIDPSEKRGLTELMQKELDFLPPRFEGDRTGRQKRIYD